MKNRLLAPFFTALLINTVAWASPITNNADFTCPAVTSIANFGQYVAGFGSEIMLGQTNQVYFQSQYLAGVPDFLSNYTNAATNYDSATGYVICKFTSSKASESPFDMLYYVTNGQNGVITSQSANKISIDFPIGHG